MTIVVGIDEAGLGPLLGPLVVTGVAVEVPDAVAEGRLWDRLGTSVSRRPRKGAVCIADSKRLYGGLRSPAGMDHLERGVLGALAAAGSTPDRLSRLLSAVAPGAEGATSQYPWYRQDLVVPTRLSPADVEASARTLRDGLALAGLRLLEIRAEIVLEGEFNRLIREEGNKSDMLFAVTARLFRHFSERYAGGRLLIHADRQGGRKRYLAALQPVFGGRWVWVLEEDSRRSRYRVEDAQRTVEVDFTVNGEEAHVPVALASMASKYLRELLMTVLNRFWSKMIPGLEPTAGYHGDGRRFFAAIAPMLEQMGTAADLAIRRR